MDLILWRHAEAREPRENEPDHERPLTAKGERQAQRMAQWLNRHLPDSTRVLASPTLRTVQTVKTLERKFKLAPELGPHQSVDALLSVARWPEAREPVLVVGHQDTLGLVAAHLLADVVQPWPIRKGAVWWLRTRKRGSDGQADGQTDGQRGDEVVLHAVLSPDRN